MILSKAMIALRAASNLSTAALIGHVRRRIRNKVVPPLASLYRARLAAAAERFPAWSPQPAAADLGRLVAECYLAEYASTIPQCFDGAFQIMNARFDFGSAEAIDWRFKGDDGNRQLRRSNLAQMGFLPAAMCVDPERALELAGLIIPDFIDSADFSLSGDFVELWHPYVASRRLQSVCAALLMVPPSQAGHPAVRSMRDFARINAAFVLRNLETELGYNHLERNLASIGLFGLCCAEFPVSIRQAVRAQFERIIVNSIEDDGVQKERSAIYQGLTVQSLRIFQALPIWTDMEQSTILSRLTSAEAALAALTLGDDLPVLFNDGWLGESPPSSVLLGRAASGFHVMPQGGYVRLAGDRWVVVFDVGPIGPDDNPGHGHPDFLSVEASFGPHRFLVDPGTFSYSSGPMRDQLRSWTAHNGPAFLGRTPVEYLGSFKVGRRSAASLASASQNEGMQMAAGLLSFENLETRRLVELSALGHLSITDEWTGDGARQTVFLVPSDWTILPMDDGHEFSCNGLRLQLSQENCELEIGQANWSRYYDQLEPAHELILRPMRGSNKATIIFRPLPSVT